MAELSVEDRKKLVLAARQNSWDRGCTCGTRPLAEIIRETPERISVGIEHLVGCPLWNPRDLNDLPEDVEPDALTEVAL